MSSLISSSSEFTFNYWLLEDVIKETQFLLGWLEEVDIQVDVLGNRSFVFDSLLDLLSLVFQTDHLVAKQKHFEERMLFALQHSDTGVDALLTLHEMVKDFQLLFNLDLSLLLRNLNFFASELLVSLPQLIFLFLRLQNSTSTDVSFTKESLSPVCTVYTGMAFLSTFSEKIIDQFLVTEVDLGNFEFATLFGVI